MIKRQTVASDIEHGGSFNNEYVDKGLVFYEKNDNTNHSDKKVNDEDLTWTRKEVDDEGETTSNGHLDVVGDENISNNLDVGNDTFIHHDLVVDNNTDIHGYTHLFGDNTDPMWEAGDEIPLDELQVGQYIVGVTGAPMEIETIDIEEDTDNNVTYYIFNKDTETETRITYAPGAVIRTYNQVLGTILEVDGMSTFHDNIQADKNVNIDGTLDVTQKTSLHDDLEVDGHITGHNGLDITGTATINGDLYVKGTSYEEHATDIFVGADFVTVRDGSNVGLEDGEISGTVIHNYNGAESLGIVSKNDGLLRIGEILIEYVYTTDGVTYYSDRELTKETTLPDDVKLFQVGEEGDDGLLEYYYLSKDDLEPVATRAENEDMIDQSVLKWDEETHSIVSTSTTEDRVIDTEVLSKNIDERVKDLESGKLNIEASTTYPVVLTRTDREEWAETSDSVLAFVAENLVKFEDDVYKPIKDLYIKDEDEDEVVYVLITDYKYDGTKIKVSIDNGTTFDELTLPVYYMAGNQESNNYHFSLTNDNVIRWYDSVAEYEEAVENGELQQDNIVMIRNAVGTMHDLMAQDVPTTNSPLTIADQVQRGNYNAVTSNAVAKAVNGETSERIDDVTIKLQGTTYELYGFTWQNLYRTFFDSETGNVIDEVPYALDSDFYWPISRAETETEDGISYYYFYYSMDEGETFEKVGGQAFEDGTLYKLANIGQMYVVAKEAFKMAHPIGSVYFNTIDEGPYSTDAEDPLTWTSLGTINGSLTGNTGEDVYMLRRDS